VEYHSVGTVEYHSVGTVEYHSVGTVEYHSVDEKGPSNRDDWIGGIEGIWFIGMGMDILCILDAFVHFPAIRRRLFVFSVAIVRC